MRKEERGHPFFTDAFLAVLYRAAIGSDQVRPPLPAFGQRIK